MCDNCDRNHEDELVNEFDLPDITGASLLLLNVLVEKYLEDEYCDPTMYRALHTARKLAVRFSALAEEHSDEDTKAGVQDIIERIDFLIIRAGEVINTIIEEHDLPVMKNTFEIDPTHPKAKRRAKKGRK